MCQLYLYITERQGCFRGLLPKAVTPGCLHIARRRCNDLFWFESLRTRPSVLPRLVLYLQPYCSHLLNTGIIGIHYNNWIEILKQEKHFKEKKRKKNLPYLIKSVKCSELHKLTWTSCENGWKVTFSPMSHQTCQVELTCHPSSGLKSPEATGFLPIKCSEKKAKQDARAINGFSCTSCHLCH